MDARKYAAIFILIAWGGMAGIWGLTWFLPEEQYMDEEYPYWMQQKAASQENRGGREILFLGDSRVKVGVRAGSFASNAYNLSLGGGSPIEMYYTLRDYLSCHANPQAVIVAFAPMHYDGLDAYVTRTLYFHYLNQDDVDETNRIWMELDGEDFKKSSQQYKYRLPVIYMKPVMRSLQKNRMAENRDIFHKAEEAKGRMFMHDDEKKKEVQTPEAANQHFIVKKTLDYYMGELLKLCTSRGIPVYVEQLPMGNPGRKKIRAERLSE